MDMRFQGFFCFFLFLPLHQRLLRLLPRLFENPLLANGNISNIEPNFAVAIQDVPLNDDFAGSSFVVPSGNRSDLTATGSQFSSGDGAMNDVIATRPIAAAFLPPRATQFAPDARIVQLAGGSLTVQYSVMTETEFYRVDEESDFGLSNLSLAAAIVTIEIGNSSIPFLPEPVTIVFTATEMVSQIQPGLCTPVESDSSHSNAERA